MYRNWDSFGNSEHPDELKIKRVDPSHPLDFYYGKDFKGNYVFTLRCRVEGDLFQHPEQLVGIDIILNSYGADQIELRLCLLDSAQVDIFKALCSNLMSATQQLALNQHKAGIQIVLHRLSRWQELLRRRREKVLSKSQIIGLWGELIFFRDVFLTHLPSMTAFASWRGPFGDEQDFQFNGSLIEVKTQLSSSDRKIQISSAEQLDTVSGEIYLCHQIVASGITGETAISLNELVDEILQYLKEKEEPQDMLLTILLEYGYMNREEYDKEKWMLNDRILYQIMPDFPVIKASLLPDAICDVKYCIRTDTIRKFAISLEQFVFAVL